MTRKTWILMITALLMISGGASMLRHLRTHQQLGLPGVKTHPWTNSNRLVVELPEEVLGYSSKWVEVDELTLNTLPQDTSFGERIYTSPDGFWMALNAVLMGTDRTSLHKPQFCLEGQGCRIDQGASREETVHIERPQPYDLPIVELIADREHVVEGQRQKVRVLYVYWYVSDDGVSASISGMHRMWWMADKLVRTGVLQRWSYLSCLAVCLPGQEEATLERMKKFIAAAVPQFQLVPKPENAPTLTAR